MSAKMPAASTPVPAASPQVVITPLKPALIANHAHTLPVLVRVQAPDADPSVVQVRQPYHLSLVIDRSGSMSGQPLQEAVLVDLDFLCHSQQRKGTGTVGGQAERPSTALRAAGSSTRANARWLLRVSEAGGGWQFQNTVTGEILYFIIVNESKFSCIRAWGVVSRRPYHRAPTTRPVLVQ
jgi:hypothetical protein